MPLDDLSSLMRARVTETLSTLREVTLMPRDLTRVLPSDVSASDDVVVLVHGIFASAGVFRPMRRALMKDCNAKVASFTHAPSVGEIGVERIARHLARLVERLPRECRVHLVGHSLGGVVARWYVQELGGDYRVAQTISLGSPFGGTSLAHTFRFIVGGELCPTSPLLARLRERAHEHAVPHTSIVAGDDRVVTPAASASFPRGASIVLAGRGHNSLLFDAESIASVVRCVRDYGSGQSIAGT